MDRLGSSVDQRRIETLGQYGIMDTAAEPQFDDIVELAANICGTPMAIVSLLDEKRQWFKSRLGLDVSETPIEIAFCRTTIRENDVFVVQDAAADPAFAHNPLVTGPPYIRFYAGAPLQARNGCVLGSLAVLDRMWVEEGYFAREPNFPEMRFAFTNYGVSVGLQAVGAMQDRVLRLNSYFETYRSGDVYDRAAITHVMACSSHFPGLLLKQ